MLLEFRAENYRSFGEGMILSMTAAPGQEGLDYSLRAVQAGEKVYAGLSSSVIYGANAAGKTNVIGAMDTFRAIVIRGHIRNAETVSSPNMASCILELIPNCHGGPKPTRLGIKFARDGSVYEYTLEMDLGPFLKQQYSRKIQHESLSVDDKLIFVRGDSGDTLKIFTENLKEYDASQYVEPKPDDFTDLSLYLARNSLSDTELFLTNGFKSIYAKELSGKILDWFTNQFIVIYRSDSFRTAYRPPEVRDDTVYIRQTINEAAKALGIASNALGYLRDADSDRMVLCSIFDDLNIQVPADQFESYGTIRLVNEFPVLLRALKTGGVLVMDEFDASIHPTALMSLIQIFHNDEINTRGAQLIFNTHNPIFLDGSLFRRDEIKFVERDPDTQFSDLYALSDFRTPDDPCGDEDYLRNYFTHRYGAIRDVDFVPAVKAALRESGEKPE